MAERRLDQLGEAGFLIFIFILFYLLCLIFVRLGKRNDFHFITWGSYFYFLFFMCRGKFLLLL